LPLTLGGLALAVSMTAMSRLTASTAGAYLIATSAVFGFGLAMVDGQISNTAVSAMPPSYAGLASGIASTGRQIGQALGVAVGGSLLNASMNGPLQVSFLNASRPAWSVLAGCGCVVALLGLVTSHARAPRDVHRPARGVPRQHPADFPPRPSYRVPPPAARQPWPAETQWIPRYLMDPQQPGHPAQESPARQAPYPDYPYGRWH
jgi:MFS family permease